MKRTRGHAIAPAIAAALVAAALCPAPAAAHGPVAPVASSYLAHLSGVPRGVQAKVVDGDQRMWLRVAPGTTVLVLDYRGAPYLRFTRAGIELNRNSEMAYLNHAPVEVPPRGLTRTTPPRWQRVGAGDQRSWHDGRLHALAAVARAPGTSYVGRWSIPVVVDGRLAAITGSLTHADAPSVVWFWPIVVVFACVLAARRLRRPRLDALVARLLAVASLIGIAVVAVARDLHGRPAVSPFQEITFAVLVAFSAWGLHRVLTRPPEFLTLVAVALVALWEGAVMIPTLWRGYVLAAVPAFAARAAAVVCVGCGLGLLLLVFRVGDQTAPEPGTAAVNPSGG